ncbi:hypothetical protein [Streptomyces sp. NPDC001307]|jgi:hypothetical protein|uniref:hypothetical protein n=1 Tax=Streptomyces sp. NPDC001307 TaxID=3364560 RepID=UPI0036A79ECD
MGFVRDVLANVAGTGVLAVLASALALAAAWLSRRSSVWKLFRVGTASRSSLTVIVPSFDIRPRTATGTVSVQAGFTGTAISELEYREALDFADALQANPVVRLLQAVGLPERVVYRPIRCRVTASRSVSEYTEHQQATAEEIKNTVRGVDCAILVGGPVYNTTTTVMLGQAPFAFTFSMRDENGRPVRGVEVRPLHGNTQRTFRRVEPQAGDGPHLEYAVVEAVDWEETRVFLCAGTCAAATAAAVRKLRQDWRQLAKRFGGSGFGLVYELALDSALMRDRAPDMGRLQQCYVYPLGR